MLINCRFTGCIVLIGLFAVLFWPSLSAAQPQMLDRIVAIVDEEVILQSQWEQQYKYYLNRGQKDDGTLKCAVIENMLSNYLLLAKARLDSLEVSEEQIQGELNRRISTVVAQMGGEENLQKTTGKSVVELKIEMRGEIEQQLLIEAQKRRIFGDVEVTPREVKDYFKTIPQDSLPYLPSEVELSHIVIKPKASPESKKRASDLLAQIRADVLAGKSTFEEMAIEYSHDGSAKEGGNLGEFARGTMVPEFEEVAYNLNPGEISEPFESQYGFHIIKLKQRNGDNLVASHILIIPEITKADEAKAFEKLNDIKRALKADSLTFEEAARKYSEDRQSKEYGGMIQSDGGDFRIPLDQLDTDLYFKIDNMKPGDISEPLSFNIPQEKFKVYYHIVWLRKRFPPHRANLKDDYQKFMGAAKQAKQAESLEKWFEKAKRQVFIEIKDNECSKALSNWN